MPGKPPSGSRPPVPPTSGRGDLATAPKGPTPTGGGTGNKAEGDETKKKIRKAAREVADHYRRRAFRNGTSTTDVIGAEMARAFEAFADAI